MREPNRAGAAVAEDGQGPVGQAACNRRRGGQEPDLDEALARAARVVAAEQVEHGRADERPDDHIGQQRMERMTEPRARQGVPRRADGDDIADRVGELECGGVERFDRLERSDRAVG